MFERAPSLITHRCNTVRIAIRTVSQVGAGSELSSGRTPPGNGREAKQNKAFNILAII